MVAYNSENVSEVWLIENGCFVPFELIERIYDGKTLDAVFEMNNKKKQIVANETRNNLQSKIDLSEKIETIVDGKSRRKNVGLKNIRATRQREIERTHVDFVKEGMK